MKAIPQEKCHHQERYTLQHLISSIFYDIIDPPEHPDEVKALLQGLIRQAVITLGETKVIDMINKEGIHCTKEQFREEMDT